MNHEHPVAVLAGALKVNPRGLHAHRQKAQRQRHQEDGKLSAALGPIFAASHQTHGGPRITAAWRAQSVRCGKNRVARLMRENRLAPRRKRKRWRPIAADSNHQQPVAENWLATVPVPTPPDQLWVADISPQRKSQRPCPRFEERSESLTGQSWRRGADQFPADACVDPADDYLCQRSFVPQSGDLGEPMAVQSTVTSNFSSKGRLVPASCRKRSRTLVPGLRLWGKRTRKRLFATLATVTPKDF